MSRANNYVLQLHYILYCFNRSTRTADGIFNSLFKETWKYSNNQCSPMVKLTQILTYPRKTHGLPVQTRHWMFWAQLSRNLQNRHVSSPNLHRQRELVGVEGP